MSTFSSSAKPIHLMWTKSRHNGYQLAANGPVLGSLQRVGFWKQTSAADFKGHSWSFHRIGFAGTAVLDEPGARPVAHFKANWLGGGALIFQDGQQFQLVAKGFWKPVWSWIDDRGQTLLEVTPHSKSVVVSRVASIDELDVSHSRLPVLIMLSWHQILQADDDGAAAIAASGAAG